MKGLTLGIAVLALAAFGCGGEDTPSVSAAGEQIEDAAKDAGQATGKALEDAGEKLQESSE